MKAKFVAETLNLELGYYIAVSKLGSHHECNQGCAEGHCLRNAENHERKLLEHIAETLKQDA